MNSRVKRQQQLAQEYREIFEEKGSLNPVYIHEWAKSRPRSAIYSCLEWDDTKAGYQFRLIQIRNMITDVEIITSENKPTQVYVSLTRDRGVRGYSTRAEVLSDKQRRRELLDQVLTQFETLCEKHSDLQELASIREAVVSVRLDLSRHRRRKPRGVAIPPPEVNV